MNTTTSRRLLSAFIISSALPLIGFHAPHDDHDDHGDKQAEQNAEAPASKKEFVATPWIVGDHTWTAVPDWGQADDFSIGNTHGTVLVVPDGRVLFNTDHGQGVLV